MKRSWFFILCMLTVGSISCSLYSTNKQSERFVDNQDGTISDNKTGLMWAKCSIGQDMENCSGNALAIDWEEAILLVGESDLAGYSDWRLPLSNELATLLKQKKADRYSNAAIFPNTPESIFWISPPDVNGSYYASDPLLYYGHTDFGKPVRLVRGK